MSKQEAAQSSVSKGELVEKLEQLTREEQQAERDLRKVQEQIKFLKESS